MWCSRETSKTPTILAGLPQKKNTRIALPAVSGGVGDEGRHSFVRICVVAVSWKSRGRVALRRAGRDLGPPRGGGPYHWGGGRGVRGPGTGTYMYI